MKFFNLNLREAIKDQRFFIILFNIEIINDRNKVSGLCEVGVVKEGVVNEIGKFQCFVNDSPASSRNESMGLLRRQTRNWD